MREPEGIDEFATAEELTTVALVSEADEAAIHECIVEEKDNNGQSYY